MRIDRTTFNRNRTTTVVLLLCAISVAIRFRSVEALSLVNPTAPPPAGQTARPLNTGNNNQTKSGSLVIGVHSTNCSTGHETGCTGQLCLNGSGSGACIKSWQELAPGISSQYVQLIPDTFATPPAAPNPGFINLKGTDNQTRPITVNATPSIINGASALYADGMTSDNYAGYFIGQVAINSIPSANGQICLNSKYTYDDVGNPNKAFDNTYGYYCITNWNDIQSLKYLNTTNKLTLATTTSSPTAEAGNVSLGLSFGAGTMVIGDPSSLPLAQQCGDGFCSAPESTANSCPIDCNPISQLISFTAQGQNGSVKLRFSLLGGTWNIVIARSTQSNFLFAPVDGVNYTEQSGTDFSVVVARKIVAPTGLWPQTIMDFSVTNGVTYYYRAFIGNTYPRYSSVTTQTATPVAP